MLESKTRAKVFGKVDTMETYHTFPSVKDSTAGAHGKYHWKDNDRVLSGILPQKLTATSSQHPPATQCHSAVRCSSCGHGGHSVDACQKFLHKRRGVWVPKSIHEADDTHSSFLQSGHASAPAPSTTPMANYPLNIIPYLPPGMTIELGPADRKVRADMVVGPIPPPRHNFLAIAEANSFIPFHQKADLRNIIDGLLHESHYFPSEVLDHPLGVGLFGFASSVIRDAVVGTSTCCP